MIYFSTGNPGPDLNGAVRAGRQPIQRVDRGARRRDRQIPLAFSRVHHDLWDYDAPNPVVLFDARYDGRMRKGLAQVGKTGFTYILDRTTGEPLIGIEERAVPQEPRQATAATQPYPDRRRRRAAGSGHRPRRLQARERRPYLHAVLGEARAHEAARYGRRELAAELLRSGDPSPLCLRPRRARRLQQQRRDRLHDADAGRPLSRGYLQTLGRARARHFFGRGRQDQQARVAAAVGGDVLQRLDRHGRRPVFVGRNDSRFTALDKTNGDLLWDFATDAAVHATASTFEHDGQQYVIVLAARDRSSRARSTATAYGCSRSTGSSWRSRSHRPSGAAPSQPRTDAGD